MASQNEPRLVADRFAIDLTRPMSWAAGGLPAYAVSDRQSAGSDLMAIAVDRRAPPRLRPLQVLNAPQDGLLTPLAHGVGPGRGGDDGYYVISAAPPGPSLATTLHGWRDADLIAQFLRPAARVLVHLQTVGVTHRAIRLDNVFAQRPGGPVVLGNAWASPPAMHQPAIYEPPYAAMCLPAGRGEGSIADDVYALGVVLLILACGRVPMADLDAIAIIYRKIELGSYQALVGDVRLPQMIADLARAMLAEDPADRPTPAALLDPTAAKTRRRGTRVSPRAQRPLQLGRLTVWDRRTLAFALATESLIGLQAVTQGVVARWLRRDLGGQPLASQVDELVRRRQADGGDALLMMRLVVMLDPLAPLCWVRVALWPDAVGSALAAVLGVDADITAALHDMIETEAIAIWGDLRPDRCDHTLLRLDARQYRAIGQIRGIGGGLWRLVHTLCPLMPCASPMIAGRWSVTVGELALALEVASGKANHDDPPVDGHVAAFLAARSQRRLESELDALSAARDAAGAALARLQLLAAVQHRFCQQPLPALSAWMVDQCQILVGSWQHRQRRAALEQTLRDLAMAGFLTPIVALFADGRARAEDAMGAHQAAERVAAIDTTLQRLADGREERRLLARRIGQEIATGVGLAALAAVLGLATLR
jgi:hypothetical protein